MPVPFPRTLRLSTRLVPVLLLVAACQDAPTIPHALQQFAGGQEWAAMTVPRDLPSTETWLPYVAEGSGDAGRGLARVRALETEARQAAAKGELDRALGLRHEAEREAVASLARNPPAAVLQQGLSAAGLWAERVRGHVDLERAPELARSLRSVESSLVGAAGALTAGDTATAILRLASASERIRAHAPEAVALRVLAAVETRVRAQPEQGRDARRALHLISAARMELVSGDPKRALQRALYALQISDGNAVRDEEETVAGGCPAPVC